MELHYEQQSTNTESVRDLISRKNVYGYKKTRYKTTRGKKVKVKGFKKAIITLKKGQNIDLTSGI